MKTLQNNFTTTEQSKRLLELGVPRFSADCYYGYYSKLSCMKVMIIDSGGTQYKVITRNDIIPCWSVGRLQEIFQICSYNRIKIYDLDLDGTQIERAMQAFENYAKYNRLDFSKLGE